MDISFQSISGQSIKGLFKKADTISTVCNFLSSSLNVPTQLIRIRNPNNSSFLSDVSKIEDFITKNYKKADIPILIYVILPAVPSSLKKNKKKTLSPIKNEGNYYSKYDNAVALPQSFIDTIKSLSHKPSSTAIRIYQKYTQSFDLPSDFYEKVESLHQMGFEIEESKEALRASEFNVQRAVNQLINDHNNRHEIDEDVLRNGHHNLIELLELVSIMRNDNGNMDRDRINNLIRLIARRNVGDDDDDQNDNHHARFEFRRAASNHSTDDNDDDSVNNQELNYLMEELNDKLVSINEDDIFNAFSSLIDETRDVIAASKDDQIVDFISFLNDYIDQNDNIPQFFQRKIEQLIEYFENEDSPDIDYLIRILDKIISHDYYNNDSESDEEEEEEEIETD